MARKWFEDSIPSLLKNSGTQVQFTGSPSALIHSTVGGKQHHVFSSLVLNTGSVGLGGLDAGTLGINQVWYVHFAVSGGVLGLVASLSKVAPTGFTNFKWSGWVFVTNDFSQVAITANTTMWDPISFTSSSSWTTTTITGFLKRTGGFVEIFYKLLVTVNNPSGGALTLNLPTNLVIDTTKTNSSGVGTQVFGVGQITRGGSNNYGACAIYNSTTSVGIRQYQTTGAGANPVIVNVTNSIQHNNPVAWQATDDGYFNVVLPIVGWQANVL